MRHALGVLGVLAAGVLLAVSAAMNWRFGYQLGRTDLDGQILGAASAAADCFKALVPFFFFAALRNRAWSQALASAAVWVVVTGYSMTSAIGNAELNRDVTAGQRQLEGQQYADLRAGKERLVTTRGWVPASRPAATVDVELNALKSQREWQWTSACTDLKAKSNRDYCQKVHALESELASATKATELDAQIAAIDAKLEQAADKAGALREADPQASALANILGMPKDRVRSGLSLLVALLVEIGSGLGMYVAFAQWRIYDRPAEPRSMPAPVTASVAQQPRPALTAPKARATANDNRSITKPVVEPRPLDESTVQRFHKDQVVAQDGSTLTTMELWESYCAWCEEKKQEPLALPTFGREFGELGITKAKIAGKVRFIGIALKGSSKAAEEKKPAAFRSVAA